MPRLRRPALLGLLAAVVGLLFILLLPHAASADHDQALLNATPRWTSSTTIEYGNFTLQRTSNGQNGTWVFMHTEPHGSGTNRVQCSYTLTFTVDPYNTNGGGQSAYRVLHAPSAQQCRVIDQDSSGRGTLIAVANAGSVNADGEHGTNGQGVPGGGGGTEGEEDGEVPIEAVCELSWSPLSWIICPITNGIMKATEFMDSAITSLMTVETSPIFNSDNEEEFRNTSSAYHAAWSSFRTMALGIIVIIALIVIVSSAFGLEVFDAYTIRKALPRVALAVILIALSWDILEFLVSLSNDVGNGVRALIYAPFSGFEQAQIQFGQQGAFTLILTASFLAYGPLALLSFAATAGLAALVAFLILVLREMIIILLIIVAPIAFTLMILPNTQKYWQFWQNTLTAMLLAFPIIAAFIATGRVFSAVAWQNGEAGTISGVIAFIAYFLPYFLLPLTFRLAGGLLAQLGNIANNSERGAFDRLKNYRASKMSERYNQAREGRGGFVGANMAGKAYRRASLGGNPFTRKGRAQYNAEKQHLFRGVANKALEHDAGFAAGNDDANALALQKGMTRDRFVQAYSEKLREGNSSLTIGEAKKQASAALGELETGYGAQMGTATMRQAAFKARAASNKGYDYGNLQANQAAIYGDAASLVNDGVLNTSDAAAIIKSNKARTDYSASGFGNTMGQIEATREALKRGERGLNLVTQEQSNKLADDIMTGAGPGELVAMARHESVEALAPHFARRVNESIKKAEETGDVRHADEALAATMGLYDELSRASPMKAKLFAEGVSTAGVKDTFYGREQFNPDTNKNEKVGLGDMVTLRELMERARDRSPTSPHGGHGILERRREYGSRYAAQSATEAQRAAQEFQDRQNPQG